MNFKNLIISLISVLVVAGGLSEIFYLNSENANEQIQTIFDDAIKTVQFRDCGKLNKRACAEVKSVQIKLLGELHWSWVDEVKAYDNVFGVYGTAPDSAKQKAKMLIEQDEITYRSAIEHFINGLPNVNTPAIDVDALMRSKQTLNKSANRSTDIAIFFAIPACISGIILLLIAAWTLFLSMIRSFRKAWLEPNRDE